MIDDAHTLFEVLCEKNKTFATAESCTGGMLATCFTDISGVSKVFQGGVVVYSNEAKISLLGLSHSLLEEHGAVSAWCAEAMAHGVLSALPDADMSLAITGIAGPTGGTPHKPVGLVFGACVMRGGQHKIEKWLMDASLGRAGIREESVCRSLRLALHVLMSP